MSTPAESWDHLVTFVVEEFSAHGQDPGAVFEPDHQHHRLRARLTPGANNPEWFAVDVTAQQLETADLKRKAQDFYAAYRSALDK